jgi:microcin C transport system ATP-binding protein
MPLIPATEASRTASAPGSDSQAQGEALLTIRDLSVDFSVEDRTVTAVQGRSACPSIRGGPARWWGRAARASP